MMTMKPLCLSLECVSPPSHLSAGSYVLCVCLVLMAALFSCLQVYTNRLRRAIAAFYYPKVTHTHTHTIFNPCELQ